MSHSCVQSVLLGRIEVVTCCNIFSGLRISDPHCARVVWHGNSWLTGLCCWFLSLSLSHSKNTEYSIVYSLQIVCFSLLHVGGHWISTFSRSLDPPKVPCTKSDSSYGCEIASSLDCFWRNRAGPCRLIPVQNGSKGKGCGRVEKSKTNNLWTPKALNSKYFEIVVATTDW